MSTLTHRALALLPAQLQQLAREHAGCAAADVLAAAGLELADAAPDAAVHHVPAGPGPSTWASFAAALDALELLVAIDAEPEKLIAAAVAARAAGRRLMRRAAA